ncbi:MAG: hypothetical protein DRI34_08850 [Deltaproteobacteria bacterium]|nr:MAG: hypothetical protein DRI34_08850 [Deltaproteobacteria bacterium]
MSPITAADLKFTAPEKDFFRFLLVDDENVARNVLSGMLQAAGYQQIDEAGSAEQAFELLRQQEYHLAFVDKNLPGADGFAVLREGRKLWPDCEFIMITAYGSTEAASQAMDLGASSFLQKPFPELQGVMIRVEEALGRVVTRLENRYLIRLLHDLVDEIEESRTKLKQLVADKGSPEEAPPASASDQVAQATRRLKELARALQELFRSSQVVTQDLIHLVGREIEAAVNMLEKGDS